MNIKKSLLLMSLALFVNLLFIDMGMTQTKRADDTFFLSGPVKDISWDRRAIMINERKFFTSQETIIVDQTEKKLKLEDLKQDSDVAIEAFRQPNGSYLIKKIVVITNKGV